MDKNTPDLKSKVILIYMHNRPLEEAVVLEDAHFEQQGGRLFLVGRFAEGASENDWASGVKTSLAWDRVDQYFLFDTLAEYLQRAAQAMARESVH